MQHIHVEWICREWLGGDHDENVSKSRRWRAPARPGASGARAARSAVDQKAHALDLLDDPSFVCSLHVADRATFDMVAEELQRLGLTKRAIGERVQRFADGLRQSAAEAEDYLRRFACASIDRRLASA